MTERFLNCDFIIATVKLDPHADAVIHELSQRGFSVFRLNTDATDDEYQMSCVCGRLDLRDMFGRIFSTDNQKAKIGYYRKPRKLDTLNGSKAERFVASERNGFFDGVFTHPNIEWINPRHSILAAQSKIGQHQVAKDLGFSVPETLVTNSPKMARDFAESVGWELQ